MYKQFTPLQLTNWLRVNNYKRRRTDASIGYLTGLKVSCLLYYVQGCMLGAYNQRVFKENIETWDAPIIKSIIDKYDYNKVITIHKSDKQAFNDYKIINNTYPINRIMRTIYMKLGDWTALQLKHETREEYPYHHAKYMLNNVVSPQSIKYYFQREVVVP